jgi:ribosomal protein L1
MKVVRSIARVLGPRGSHAEPEIRPTVTAIDVVAGIEAVEGRHASSSRWTRRPTSASALASVQVTAAQILENAAAGPRRRRQGQAGLVRGTYIRTAALSSSQSPAVQIASSEYSKF